MGAANRPFLKYWPSWRFKWRRWRSTILSMADQAEVNERIGKVYSLLLRGVKRRDVVKWAQKNYNVSQKQAYNYVTEAIDLRSEDLQEYRKNAISDQVATLRALYTENYKIQDFKECRAILAQIATLLGLNEPTKVNANIKSETPIFTPIDLDVPE